MKIKLFSKRLDLLVNWKLSRNETLFKDNFFIEVSRGHFSGIGEIAPNIRYDETAERINSDFEKVSSIDLTKSTIFEEIEEMDLCHSFKFGLTSAITHLLCQESSQSVSAYFSLNKPSSIDTSFSVPIMQEHLLEEYLKKIERFKYIKIKVNSDNAISFVKAISEFTDKPLRVDGNEAWESLEKYLVFEKEVSNLNIQFIEQPFKASMTSEYKKLKDGSRFEIMADESIESDVDMKEIAAQFHSVNIKLMKASSYQNAIRLITQAKENGLKVMIGCMIESSLGISSAMNLNSLGDYFDLDGSLLLKNDPYDFIREEHGEIKLLS